MNFINDINLSGSINQTYNTGVVNLNQNQLQNAVIHVLAAAPSTPSTGQVYFDSVKKALGIYTSDGWIYTKLDNLTKPTSSVDLNNQKIINLATPTNSTDAANKGYVDNAVSGFNWKADCKAATTANISGTYDNSGMTFTYSGTNCINNSGIDGLTNFAQNDRILIKNQTAALQNGIYIVTTVGVQGTTATVLTRATDNNEWSEIFGTTVAITSGTTNASTLWVSSSVQGGTIGTTAITFAQIPIGTITAGDGLTKNGNTLSANVDNQTTQITSNNIAVKLNSTGVLTSSASGLNAATDANTIDASGQTIKVRLDSSNVLTSTASGIKVSTGANTIDTTGNTLNVKIDSTGLLASSTSGISVQSDTNTIDRTSNTVKVRLNSAGAITADSNGLKVGVETNSMQITSNTIAAKLNASSGLSSDSSGIKIVTDGTTITTSGNALTLATAYKNQKVVITGTQTSSLSNTFTHNLGNATHTAQLIEISTGLITYCDIAQGTTSDIVSAKVATNWTLYKLVVIG